MTHVLLRTLVCLIVSGTAQAEVRTTRISLKPVLDTLSVEDLQIRVRPIRTVIDINNPDVPTVMRSSGAYPIEAFSAAPNGRLIAVAFDKEASPKGSNLDRKAVLIGLEGDQPRILKVLGDSEAPTLVGLRFLANSILRIERVGDAAEGSREENWGYLNHYEFHDPRTGQTVRLEEKLAELHIRDVSFVRAYGENYYLVEHAGKTGSEISAFHFKPGTDRGPGTLAKLQRLGSRGAISEHFLHDPVDERDVTEAPDSDEVSVRAHGGSTLKLTPGGYRTKAREKKIELSPGARTGQLVVNAPELFWEVIGSRISIYGVKGRLLVQRWDLDSPAEFWGEIEKTPAGFVARQAHHPEYGYSLLKTDGTIEKLGDSRLIHESRHPGFIAGVSDLKRGTYSVDFVRIEYAPELMPQDMSPEADLTPRYGYPTAYPLVEAFPGGRHVLVRTSPNELGVVDMFLDQEIVARLELAAPDFRLAFHPGTFVVEYPALGKRHVYHRGGRFSFAISQDFGPLGESCRDLLSPR